MTAILVHRFGATGAGTPVNAYVLRSPDGSVVVDATLTVSDGRALRAHVDSLGVPLLGVVLTHTHPDHYGGLVELVRDLDVPVYATQGVSEAIVRDDAAKETILRPMCGDEWAHQRAFPDRIAADGQVVTFGSIALRVTDLGPGESPHDSMWSLVGDSRIVFSGDVAYDRRHCYLADGQHEGWLHNIARLRAELPQGTTLHPGHGEPCGLEALDWQEGYIATFLAAVARGEPREAIVQRMLDHLPTDELRFLMELSVEPLQAALAA
jgi:glyoxylase-like metal-dependent hydrolase (beta-lactamase superfamily II)